MQRMQTDPIIGELRAVRDEHAARCGYDVEEIRPTAAGAGTRYRSVPVLHCRSGRFVRRSCSSFAAGFRHPWGFPALSSATRHREESDKHPPPPFTKINQARPSQPSGGGSPSPHQAPLVECG